jgi:hypothetical protein
MKYINDFKFVEYREKPWRKNGDKPQVVTKDSLIEKGGFISCYAVDEEGKKHIESQGHVRDLTLPVWSQWLFIDFDDCPHEADRFEEFLTLSDIEFTMWDSGNRSYHFHILRDAEPSPHLPWTDKKWVEANAPEADMSLYASGGMHPFRLPGTIHEKTNKAKVLVSENKGDPLKLDIQEPPPLEVPRSRDVECIFLDQYVMRRLYGFDEGRRYHPTLALTMQMLRNGYDVDFIETWIRHVNMLSLRITY